MRPLGGNATRLQLERALPLRPGDRLLLRDPGSRQLWGGTVLDSEPPPLTRRGDARRRAAVLEGSPDELPSLPDELRRRPCVSQTRLRRFGVDLAGADELAVRAGDWLLDRALVPELGERIRKSVAAADSLDAGVATAALAHELDIPMPLVEAVAPHDLVVRDGRVRLRSAGLPERVSRAVDALLAGLASPFDAPPRDRLGALGLDRRAVAAAGRAGRLLVLDEGVVLAPGADAAAVAVLARLPQPFTASEARQALGSSRRVVLPLLELLDRSGRTLRLPDDRRRLR
jgi:selenocysteine-specific elongation factor